MVTQKTCGTQRASPGTYLLVDPSLAVLFLFLHRRHVLLNIVADGFVVQHELLCEK